MAETWKEVDRIFAPSGSEDRHAVATWVGDKRGFSRGWHWVEILVGTFRIEGVNEMHAIRKGGEHGLPAWVFFVSTEGVPT